MLAGSLADGAHRTTLASISVSKAIPKRVPWTQATCPRTQPALRISIGHRLAGKDVELAFRHQAAGGQIADPHPPLIRPALDPEGGEDEQAVPADLTMFAVDHVRFA